MIKHSFNLPTDSHYLCGHSLGPSPKVTCDYLREASKEFSLYGVAAWNNSDWLTLPHSLGKKVSELIGADESEVIICESTITNLYKVLYAAINLQSNRNIILTTDDNFPADLYIADGLSKLKVVARESVIDNLSHEVSVLMLTHVSYRDSSLFDMKLLTEKAHNLGILVVWDLCHSTGIVPLSLSECDVDFAVGCTYKYLSGGPGSPAFIYANKKHFNQMKSPIQGWLGHDEPFSFKRRYQSTGINKFMGGTPYVFSLKALQASLSLFDRDLIQKLYDKANIYSERVIRALQQMEVDVFAPIKRGGHIAFCHNSAYGISRSLIASGYICDYRAPNLIRVCVNPLYLSKSDLDDFVAELKIIIESGRYLSKFYNQRQKVT